MTRWYTMEKTLKSVSAAPPENFPDIRNKKCKYTDNQKDPTCCEKNKTRQIRCTEVYCRPSNTDQNQACNECNLALTDHDSCTSPYQ
ncbi:hypothetical protein Mboo_0974 [Methanoregula boonei 6A8]|uniref:Uncharacterized protein n=1 Tax=Methanoregula boonei (strain DSM 21154 / JCM 14090 / 6A8) TaxID=456442 RepID=A7I6Y1_METB6|nr:hypothetical protein Mboo_0974 [Methanoregula boonei 6A8]